MIKSRKWILGPALLAAALGTATLSHTVIAQPEGKAAAKPRKGAGKANRTPLITPMMLEKIVGTPLTEAQKTAVADAAKAYQESIAKAVGLTADELAAKAKEYRKAQRTKKADA